MFGIDLDVFSVSRPATHLGVFNGCPLDHVKEFDGKWIFAIGIADVLLGGRAVCNDLEGSNTTSNDVVLKNTIDSEIDTG